VDLGTLDQQFFIGPTATDGPEDNFIALVSDNVGETGGFSFFPNFLDASTGDTGVLSNNVMILPVAGTDLGFVAGGATKIHYGIAMCPGFNAICGSADWTPGQQGTTHCGGNNASYVSFDGPFTYDPATPGVDGTGQALLEDLNGATLAVGYNVNNLTANGSTGMLLLHSHNTEATSAEVVILDRIFANGFESN
jgi:hypothetical protein